MSSATVEAVRAGYTFDQPSLQLGVLVEDGHPLPEVPVGVTLSMLNRHGLVAGATGTGKTKTLQLMAEQISRAGIPVFAADIKGDLSAGRTGVRRATPPSSTRSVGRGPASRCVRPSPRSGPCC